MKHAVSIILLLSSAVLPNFAADGDHLAVKRRDVRSAANPAIPVYQRKAKQDSVSKIRRIIAPLSPVAGPIVEPPVPKSFTEDFIKGGPVVSFEEIVAPAVPVAVKTKSVRESEADKAIGIAQSYFRRSLWESAAEWYLKALDWNPASSAAGEGFVMSAFQAGQYNYAYRIGNEISATIPGVKDKVVHAANEEVYLLLENRQLEQAGEILENFPIDEPGFLTARAKLKALESQPSARSKVEAPATISESNPLQLAFLKAAHDRYRRQQFASSLDNLEQAESEGPLDRSAQFLRGWNLYQTGRYGDAASQFEKLYQTQTDIESARGIVVSLRQNGDHERLELLVNKWGGILAGESKAVETAAFDLNDVKRQGVE